MKLQDYCLKVEKFIPLTYLEVIQGKPLIIKLSDKWNFITYPCSAQNFALLINRKDYIGQVFETTVEDENQGRIDAAEKHKRVMLGIRKLIDMLYELSKQEYIGKENEYRKFLEEFFLKDTELLIETFVKVLNYNSRLEKKNQVPDKLQGVSKPGPVDRWSGVLNGGRVARTTPFLQYIIECEERTRAQIREYENAKKNKPKGNQNKLPGLNR
jgi:hypothetical protein